MKIAYKLVTVLGLLFVFASCDHEKILFDGNEAPAAFSFARTSQTVGICNPVVEIGVEVTRISNEDRVVEYSVNPNSTAEENEYVLGTAVIPAGEYVGSFEVEIDFEQLSEGDNRELILDLEVPDDSSINFRGSTTVSYASACVLNEIEFNFVLDNFPEEFDWQLLNAQDEIIAGDNGFGFYADTDGFVETLCLPSGDYTLVLRDSFGDGFCCANGNGSLTVNSIECSGNEEILEVTSEFDGAELTLPLLIE